MNNKKIEARYVNAAPKSQEELRDLNFQIVKAGRRIIGEIEDIARDKKEDGYTTEDASCIALNALAQALGVVLGNIPNEQDRVSSFSHIMDIVSGTMTKFVAWSGN